MKVASANAIAGRRVSRPWMRLSISMCALCLSLFASTNSALARTLNPAEFTQAVIDAFAKQDPPVEASSAGLLSIQFADARPGQKAMSLNTIYREYLRSPKELDAVLGRFVGGIYGTVAAPEFTREDRLKILPVLKSGKWMKDAADKAAAGGTLLTQRWNGLHLLYGVERKGFTAFLRKEDLIKVGVPPEKILDLATRNLGRLAEAHKTHFVDPFWVIEIDRKHEAALLLVEQFWDSTYLGINGDVIAAIPTNGLLAIVGSDDWDQVDRLRQMAEGEYGKERYGVSSKVFVRRNGRFYPYGSDAGRSRSKPGPRGGFWFWD